MSSIAYEPEEPSSDLAGRWPAREERGSWPDLARWLAAAILVCGCGRASLSTAVDAAVDRSVAMDMDHGSDATGGEADGPTGANARDTRRDAPVDAAADGPCPPGFGLCPAGTAAPTCIDLRTSQNCGACGRVCQGQTTCVDGACVSICPVGTTPCPGVAGSGCVNLAGSQDHCGRCGHACGPGQVCRDATCQPACRSTLSWDLPEMTPMPSSYGLVTLGDLDGDGALDCVSTSRDSVQLWRNQGSGRFQPWTVDLPALEKAESISSAGLGDFNGDGRLDLMVALYGDSSSYLRSFVLLAAIAAGGYKRVGTTNPALPAPIGGWAVADMDGDGRADLVVGEKQQISVWLGQTDGSLTESSRNPHPSNFYSLLVADLNGDGIKDVVADSSSPLALQVFLGLGHGQLAPAVGSPQTSISVPLVARDLDGDGMPELLAGTMTGALLLHASKDGQLVDPQPLVDDSPVNVAAFFDLNKDGKLDFISHTQSQELRISFGNGDLSFGSPQRYACPESSTLTVEDFDRDGRDDLAMYSTYPESMQVLRGRDGGFPGFRIDPEAQGADDVVWSGKDPVVADLNEDGIPDTAKLTANKSTLEVSLGGGVDAGAPTVSYPVSSASGLLVLDVDVDGHQDLVVPSEPNGTITILLGRGDGTFEQRLSIPVAIPSSSVIGFSQPHPGRGRDLLHKRTGAGIGVPKTGPTIGVAISTGSICPSRTGP